MGRHSEDEADLSRLWGQVQASINDLQRFGRTVKLKAFQPFTTAENALENMNAISEHMCTDDLKVRSVASLTFHQAYQAQFGVMGWVSS